MAVTTEQRAVLQLLLERGQSYADLATLLGVGEDEVRARARAALAELAGADPDRHVGLTDYLLGQADPIGRADAVRHLQGDPADHKLASDLAATDPSDAASGQWLRAVRETIRELLPVLEHVSFTQHVHKV